MSVSQQTPSLEDAIQTMIALGEGDPIEIARKVIIRHGDEWVTQQLHAYAEPGSRRGRRSRVTTNNHSDVNACVPDRADRLVQAADQPERTITCDVVRSRSGDDARDLEHAVRRMLQALDGYWLHCDGLPDAKIRTVRSHSDAGDWWHRFERYRERVERLLKPTVAA